MPFRTSSTSKAPRVRKGQAPDTLQRERFHERFMQSFQDPAFEAEKESLQRIELVAWEAYQEGRKAPVTRKAGPGYADPEYELSVDWLEARARIDAAQAAWGNPQTRSRVLLVNGSPRNDGTCPGEISKTWRLVQLAQEVLDGCGIDVDVLDLSLLTSEYGRHIHPCKGCVSTAMPLCHWPCSCYPNHALRQTGDWMNEIYERWVAAHGVMLFTPTHWYQSASPLKLMADRLVRRWRQPRPHQHPRQEARRSQGPRARGLGLSQAPERPGLRRGGARRRGRRRELAPQFVGLARLDGPDRCGRAGPARPLHRLLRALCEQPRQPRRR
ncbi:hypothetical protein GmRootV213_48230 [Variovorax sp. V213]